MGTLIPPALQCSRVVRPVDPVAVVKLFNVAMWELLRSEWTFELGSLQRFERGSFAHRFPILLGSRLLRLR